MNASFAKRVLASIIACMVVLHVPAQPTPLGENLLVNGGGEAGERKLGTVDGSDYFDVPGWEVREGRWAAQDKSWYGIGAPERNRHIRPLPSANAVLTQDVELRLSKNKPRYVTLSAMIRNWNTSSDLPSAELELLDRQQNVLTTKKIGPIKNASWKRYAVFAEAPADTASARVRLSVQRTAGTDNDGYFDNLQLIVLDREPLLADFTVERIAGSLPPRYRFVDTTAGDIKERVWAFTDGVKLDGKSVTRTFDQAGGFGVSLTVTAKGDRKGTLEMSNLVTISEDDLQLQIIKGPYLQMPTQDGMTIMWETNVAATSAVVIGSGSDQRQIKSEKPVTIHEVRVEGYKADQTVPYHVHSAAGEFTVKSEASTFTTAPTADQHWRLAVWGDSQDRPHVFGKLVEAMGNAEVDLMLGVGDLVSTGTVYEQWENRLFTPIGPVAKHTPFIAVLGNHEYNAQWWYRLMSLPNNERWYAYTYGNARFVMLDTNAPFGPGSDQYQWLVKQLKSKESKNAKWLIVAHHHPPFSEIYEENIYKRIREQLWPLYEKYGVDINFHGHVHLFESGEHTPEATGRRIMSVQTSGGGGTLWKDEFDGEWPQIDKVVQWKHHWCLLDFKGDELLFKAIDLDGKSIDEWKLKALPR